MHNPCCNPMVTAPPSSSDGNHYVSCFSCSLCQPLYHRSRWLTDLHLIHYLYIWLLWLQLQLKNEPPSTYLESHHKKFVFWLLHHFPVWDLIIVLEFLCFFSSLCFASLFVSFCYFYFASSLYYMCLMKCRRVTRFVRTIFWVRSLLWLSSNSTFSHPYKRLVVMRLNWSYQISPIVEVSKHRKYFFLKMDVIKDR